MKTIVFALVLAFVLPVQFVQASPPTIGEETPVSLPCPPGKWRLKVTMTDGSVRYDKCKAPTPTGYYDRSVYGAVGAQGAIVYNDIGLGISPELVGDLAIPIGTTDWDWLFTASFGGASGVMTGSLGTGPALNFGQSRFAVMVTMAGSGDGDSQDFLGIGGEATIDWVFAKGADVDWGVFLGFAGGVATLTDTPDGHARNDASYIRGAFGLKAHFGRPDY